MLIRFLHKSYFPQYFLLFVIAAALWAKAFISPCDLPATGPESPLYRLVQPLIPAGHMAAAAGFLLLLFEAFFLNMVLVKHDLVPKNSLVGALVFILLMSQPGQALTINPQLLAALFMIPAFNRILDTYGQPDPTRQVFSASLLAGLASLFLFPSMVTALVLLVSLAIFGTFSPRILLVSVSGVFTVYLYLFIYYFVADDPGGHYKEYIGWFRELPPMALSYQYMQYILWAVTGLFLVRALVFVANHLNEWNISKRKAVLMAIWFLLLASGAVVYLRDDLSTGLTLAAVPAAVLVSIYFTNGRKVSVMLEIFVVIWFLATFINNLIISTC